MLGARSNAQSLTILWLAASAALITVQVRDPAGLGDAAYLAVAAGTAAAAWVATAILRGRHRVIGAWFAAALTASATGDTISRVIGWQAGTEPEASAADPAWLAAYVFLAAGLLVLLRHSDPHQRRDLDGLLDVAAVSVAGMMVVWQLAVSATLADPSLSINIRVLWGMYPVLDLAILALALRVALRVRTLAAALVSAAVTLWLAADVAYLAIADAASYSVMLDAGWLAGGIMIALAVAAGPLTPLRWRTRQRTTPNEASLGRILVALLPLLVPGLLELQWFLRGHETQPLIMVTGTAILVLLAFLRMARLARSTRWARDALASQQRYATALAANSSDAVLVADEDRRVVDEAPQLAELAGRAPADLSGRNLLELVLPEYRDQVEVTFQRAVTHPGRVGYVEFRVAGGSCGGRWLAARVVNLLTDPDVRGVVVNLHDIDDRKRAEEGLSYQAFHDPLTGLPNRALFRDRVDHSLERSAGTGVEPAVIFLDLDGFKAVNDRLGHDAGDDLLRQVAARLTGTVGRADTVGRLGGDEFAILTEEGSYPFHEATELADRVLAALREPIRLGEQQVNVTASLGIAFGSRPGRSGGLLRDADVAMYRSKATGKDRWTTYRPGMRTAARERLELETDLRVALDRGEFQLFYQPIVELPSGRVAGFEALLRWLHPSRGLLAPDRFIPAAEETGMIVPIGRWVLREATSTAASWRYEYDADSPLMMAVNLSARQLEAPDLVGDVTGACGEAGLAVEHLLLEITETAVVAEPAAAAARLRQLHELGVQLAIDDFGTGYASLNYLRHYPIDIIKIDRAFVNSIPARGEFPAVLGSLLDLGRTLQLRTLAEGVEHDFQRTRLEQRHCDLAQGYAFARPMPAPEARHFLDRRRLTRPTSNPLAAGRRTVVE